MQDRLTRGFIRELDGLRGIAISLVLVHRFWPERGPLHRWASIAELGWVGVDLFFVISGFLIAGILFDTRGDPQFYRNFYARRMLRIFPLYYLFVAGCLLLFPLTQPGSYFDTPFIRSAGSPLWYLFYLGNVPETIGHDPPYVLGPIWSLAIEEQFYIVFPFLVATLEPAKLKKVLLGLIVAAPLVRLLALVLAPANERIQYLATPCRMDCISYGCLLALLLRISPSAVGTRASVARSLGIVAALCLVAFALGVLTRTTPWGRVLGYSLVAIAFTVLLAFVVQRRGESSTAFLRWPPLQYIGKICYGTYLLHRPADVLVDKLAERLDILDPQGIPDAPTSVGLLVAKFGVAIGFATASWYAFEKPILRLKDRFQPKNHPAASAVAAPSSEPKPGARASRATPVIAPE